MSDAADKQKKQAVLQRLREKQKPPVPESAAPEFAGAAAGGRKEKLKKLLQARAGGESAGGQGGRREKLRRFLQQRTGGEAEAGEGRKEKLKQFLRRRAESGGDDAAGAAGEGGGKLGKLLQQRAGRQGEAAGGRKEKLKQFLKGRGGGKLRNRDRAGQGQDAEPAKDIERPGLREFSRQPSPRGQSRRRDEGTRFTAEQLMQPPRMDFKRAIRNAAELHSSSLDEVKARREELGYRAEWLRAVLTMTEQELQLVDEALSIMSRKAAVESK